MSNSNGIMKAKSDIFMSERIDPKVLDSIWSKTLESSQIAQTPVFIDSANEKPQKSSTNVINMIGRAKFPRVDNFEPRIFGRIGLNSTGKLPGVTINNYGTSADFTIGDSKIAFDQKTGSIFFLDPLYPTGGKETLSTMSSALDYARTIKEKVAIKNAILNKRSVEIKFDDSKTITLHPAKDGIHIAKAVIVWREPNKDFQRGSMKHITRDVENSITIDNLSGGGSLKITPKQYYVARDEPRYVPYFFKQHLGQHGL
jgi:hypothetical protein